MFHLVCTQTWLFLTRHLRAKVGGTSIFQISACHGIPTTLPEAFLIVWEVVECWDGSHYDSISRLQPSSEALGEQAPLTWVTVTFVKFSVGLGCCLDLQSSSVRPNISSAPTSAWVLLPEHQCSCLSLDTSLRAALGRGTVKIAGEAVQLPNYSFLTGGRSLFPLSNAFFLLWQTEWEGIEHPDLAWNLLSLSSG